MTVWTDLFTELFFGEGAWLGFTVFLILIFLSSRANKYLNLLFIPILAFLGILYLENVSTSVNFMWSALFSFLGCALLVLQFIKHKN